jgi:hypothetical protein
MLSRSSTWTTLMCAVTLALTAEGFSHPPAVHADVPCKQWSFDGYTEFDLQNGAKLTFNSRNPWITPEDLYTNPTYVPADGGNVKSGGTLGNGIGTNDIYLLYWPPSEPFYYVIGGVRDDGIAYGIMYDNQSRHTSTSWRSAAPLRCVDYGA